MGADATTHLPDHVALNRPNSKQQLASSQMKEKLKIFWMKSERRS